jgi:hypothetical protein
MEPLKLTGRMLALPVGKDGKVSAVIAYDYVHQAWTENGRYVRCSHPVRMGCTCYGTLHQDEVAPAENLR